MGDSAESWPKLAGIAFDCPNLQKKWVSESKSTSILVNFMHVSAMPKEVEQFSGFLCKAEQFGTTLFNKKQRELILCEDGQLEPILRAQL